MNSLELHWEALEKFVKSHTKPVVENNGDYKFYVKCIRDLFEAGRFELRSNSYKIGKEEIMYTFAEHTGLVVETDKEQILYTIINPWGNNVILRYKDTENPPKTLDVINTYYLDLLKSDDLVKELTKLLTISRRTDTETFCERLHILTIILKLYKLGTVFARKITDVMEWFINGNSAIRYDNGVYYVRTMCGSAKVKCEKENMFANCLEEYIDDIKRLELDCERLLCVERLSQKEKIEALKLIKDLYDKGLYEYKKTGYGGHFGYNHYILFQEVTEGPFTYRRFIVCSSDPVIHSSNKPVNTQLQELIEVMEYDLGFQLHHDI